MKKNEFSLIIVLCIACFALGYLIAVPQNQNNTGNGQIEAIKLVPLPEKEFSSTIDIVAVKAQGEVGIVNTATVEVKPGKGRVLLALNPFVEPDTQQSAEIARSVAEKITQKSLAEKDVIYSIDAGDIKLVGGPSAGAALTMATIAAIEEKDLNKQVAITGTIQEDGTIGQIGGVIEKAAAIAEAGKSIFLVPKGQSTLVYYEKQVTEENLGRIRIQRVNYVPKTLDLNEFAKQEGWNLRIIEVNSIEEAMGYFF